MRSTINLYEGDCLPAMRKMADNQYDLAIVDPPYGINADLNQLKLANKRGFTKNAGTYKEYHKTNWDNKIPDDNYFTELFRVSANQIIWGGNYFHNLHLTGVIIWYKKGSGNFKEGEMSKTSFNAFKIFGYSRADAYINDCDINIHPTQKPVALYKWLLKNYAKEGDTILDTHLGSGSIAIACWDAGFDLTGYEIDKDYYNSAIKRFNNHKAQLQIKHNYS